MTARTPSGISLFAVDGGAPGLSRTPLATLDQTRKQARLAFRDVPARLVGAVGAAAPVVSDVLDLAAVALAAEQVGGAARVLDTAVAYAKTRVQFGRQIGSFQAVKHKCADLLIEVESARSAAYYAMWSAAQRRADLPLVASLAKTYCSDAFCHAAAENIQIHGGIGFTWEHPAHLYFKRAKASQAMFGTSAHHLALMATRLQPVAR
jgi:alkylation response protein AidB-like acyl-CoA dehydrogenase